MYEIIYKTEKEYEEKKPFISPQFPPNNLKKIKELFSLTDKELGKRLDVEPGFVSAVTNNRACFSGSITLKLLREFDLSFSSIYDIRSTITTNCEDFEIAALIVSIEKILNKPTDIYQLITKVIDDCNNNSTYKSVINFKLEIENNKLNLNLNNSPRLIDENKKSFFMSSIEKVNKLNLDINEKNDYYLISYDKKTYTMKTINIDTEKVLDIETNNLLFSLPFKKFINITIPYTDFELSSNKLKLNKDFTILRNGKLVVTNTLNEGEYKLVGDNKTALFRTFTYEDSLNKLKLYRYIKGYSMFFMANALNLTVESYRLLEIGFNKITTHQMWKIENVLGIQIENIINVDAYCEKFGK